MAKNKSSVPANETAEARFKRMATMRVNKALKAVALLGNLSGSRYKASPDQLSKIETAFREVLTETFGRMRGQKAGKETFSL